MASPLETYLAAASLNPMTAQATRAPWLPDARSLRFQDDLRNYQNMMRQAGERPGPMNWQRFDAERDRPYREQVLDYTLKSQMAKDELGARVAEAQAKRYEMENSAQVRSRDNDLAGAMELADAAMFEDAAAVDSMLPSMRPEQRRAVFARSLEARRQAAEEDARAQAMAETLNRQAQMSQMIPELRDREAKRLGGGWFKTEKGALADLTNDPAYLKEKSPQLFRLTEDMRATEEAAARIKALKDLDDVVKYDSIGNRYAPARTNLPPSRVAIPQSTRKVVVVDTQGRKFRLPESQLKTAIARGFTLAPMQ